MAQELSRRTFLELSAQVSFGTLIALVRTGLEGVRTAHALTKQERSYQPIAEKALELQQQPAALEYARNLYDTLQLDTSIPIGWIDVTPVCHTLPCFTGTSGQILDMQRSQSFSDGSVTTEAAEHTTWALQFAVQDCDNSSSFIKPGLSQAEWTNIILAIDETVSIEMYPQMITKLVDDGVGVIGSMPTWTELDHGVSEETVAAVADAYAYAQAHNVLIIIPSGNRGIDLASPPDGVKRILHELKQQFSNVLCAGGVSDELAIPLWQANGLRGSNYGLGYITCVSPIINRHVPARGPQVVSGTTFATGDMVSCIQAVQARIGRMPDGSLPDHRVVTACLTETTQYLGNPAYFGNGLLQMHNALRVAGQARTLLRKRWEH